MVHGAAAMSEVSNATLSGRAEFARGWRLVLGCLLGVATGAAALPFYTAGSFVISFRREFGWTLSQLSFAALASTFAVVLFAPLTGLAIDRFGVRLPAAFGMAALSIGFAALGSMSGAFEVYVLIILAMAILALASSPISFTRAINANFSSARGLALGLVLSGTGITAALAPPLVAGIIQDQGWRTAYFAMSALVALCLPIVFILLKDKSGATALPDVAVPSQSAIGWRDLAGDPLFVRLAAVFFFLALGVSGFVLHLTPMLIDAGVEPLEAAGIQASLGAAVIAGRLGMGFLVDRFFAPRIAALLLSITLAGLIGFAAVGPAVAGLSAFTIGLALGAEVDLIGYLTARYFGLAAYGKLYGLLYGAFIIGVGFSPIVMARLQESQGSYTIAIWVCAGCVATAIFCLATAPPFPAEPTLPARARRVIAGGG